MKYFRLVLPAVVPLVCLVFASACSGGNKGKDEPADIQSLEVQTSSLSFTADSGTRPVRLITNRNWTATCPDSWVSFSPNSGSASKQIQEFSVTVEANYKNETRSTAVTVKAGTITKTVRISQTAGKDDGIERCTVQQFRAKSSSQSVWYRVTGTIASIANYDYGNLYIYDNTGYLYVYGLTKAKSDTNDQTFSELGLKPGDELTFIGNRSDYNGVVEAGGKIPAYYEKHTSGAYDGLKASSLKAGWMELPATDASDGKDALVHYYHSATSTFKGNRNFTVYWNKSGRVAMWVAYPLNKTLMGSGSRCDTWAFDPLVSKEDQPDINKRSFKDKNGNEVPYIRGHQLPSADRLNYRENMETFYGTNIMPQETTFNSGLWSSLEDCVRTWCRKTNCDTLYVVTGTDIRGSSQCVYDNAGKEITVPVACWKAVLRYNKVAGAYSGLAAYMENKSTSTGTFSSKHAISIDSLETKLGIDLFVNLPDDIESAVEAKNPSEENWWWN